MIGSLLAQRHLRRFIEGGLVARPKGVAHDGDKDSDEDRRPERCDELRRDVVDSENCFHRSAFSAKICLFVVKLEVDQRAEHLQVRDQRTHCGTIARGLFRCVTCHSSEYLPPTRARSGPVRLDPHWKGWSYMLSAARE